MLAGPFKQRRLLQEYLRERIRPTQVGKPAEIAVAGTKLRAALDRQGRKMCICGQVAGCAGFRQQRPKNPPMLHARYQQDHHGLRDPRINHGERLLGSQCAWQNALARRDPDEAEDHRPRQRDWLVTRQCPLEPRLRPQVVDAVPVDGVEEKIEIDDLHGGYFRSASLRAISSSSRAPAIANALSRLSERAGGPMANAGQR